MRIIVTCGPSYEPLDEVRRLTNFSTGELGALMARTFADAGAEVICLRATGATYSAESKGVQVRPFATNDDLAAQLHVLRDEGQTDAIFHAAALCDYRVASVESDTGKRVRNAKIASNSGPITIRLTPTAKLIASLREWFPTSRIVGWKYELDGTYEEAIAKARRQLSENLTDACVVNGRAYGPGFGFVSEGREIEHLADKGGLSLFLLDWLQRAGGTCE